MRVGKRGLLLLLLALLLLSLLLRRARRVLPCGRLRLWRRRWLRLDDGADARQPVRRAELVRCERPQRGGVQHNHDARGGGGGEGCCREKNGRRRRRKSGELLAMGQRYEYPSVRYLIRSAEQFETVRFVDGRCAITRR